jgi:hypothetical protein
LALTYLVEIFLPLTDQAGKAFPREMFSQVIKQLKRKFGGVTVYDRSPAKGKTNTGSDDIVIFEVMTDDLDRAWWSSCRRRFEAKFAQDEVLIRAASIEKL